MGNDQHSYRQLAQQALQNDVVRAACCAILMAVLALGSLSLWLALIVPWLAYAGLWLFTSSIKPKPNIPQSPVLAKPTNEDFAKCVSLQQQINCGIEKVEHTETAQSFRGNACWIVKSLEAIAEDGKYEFGEHLLLLASHTNALLTDYLKAVRRGFDDAERRERVRENLATLDVEYERLWKQLNRDTVENLKELSDSIKKTVKELNEQPGLPGLPAELPPTAKELVPAPAADVGLTPRELEVALLVAKGLTDQKIGDELYITRGTVGDHVSNILRKLGVKTRAEIAAWIAREHLESVPGPVAEVGLNRHEFKVLQLLIKGLEDPEIGEVLHIASQTVSDHVSNILRKLGVSTRAEAAAWAVRNGLA